MSTHFNPDEEGMARRPTKCVFDIKEACWRTLQWIIGSQLASQVQRMFSSLLLPLSMGDNDWNLADKMWLLDYRNGNKQKQSSIDLGEAVAQHSKSGRSADKVVVKPTPKFTVNDWIKASVCRAQFRQQ